MLLIFIMFIFFMMHIQFLLRNLLFDTDESSYFMFLISYLFDKNVALESLLFSVACALSFAVGYMLLYKRKRALNYPLTTFKYSASNGLIWLICISGLVQVIANFHLALSNGLDYQAVAEVQKTSSFVFELRVIFLLLLSYILLNIPIGVLISKKRYRVLLLILIAYLVSVILGQARSRVFELLGVVGFSYFMWNGDRIRFKYIFGMFFALIAPNIIVLGRLGMPDTLEELVSGLFSFEYTIIFNNILSAAIVTGHDFIQGFTFTDSLPLIIPSPIRAMLGIVVEKANYYSELSKISSVGGGGFSFLAEMFTNFGWSAPILFFCIGTVIGRLNYKASFVGQVGIINATAPLIYLAFIMAFRNDLGVLIKYVIQIFFVAIILGLFIKKTSIKNDFQ